MKSGVLAGGFFSVTKAVRGLSVQFLGGIFISLLLVSISGCMGGRTLSIDVSYDTQRAPESPFAGAPELEVVLIPFEKAGGVKDVFGRWVGLRGKEDKLRSSKPVEDAVTDALAAYLKKVGFDVTMAPRGTDPESYTSVPPDIVMHGTVEAFSTEAESVLGSTKIKTEVRLRVLIVNVRDGSRLTVNVEGSSEPVTVVSFDPDVFRDTVNEVLSEAVERIFSGTVLEEGVLRPRG